MIVNLKLLEKQISKLSLFLNGNMPPKERDSIEGILNMLGTIADDLKIGNESIIEVETPELNQKNNMKNKQKELAVHTPGKLEIILEDDFFSFITNEKEFIFRTFSLTGDDGSYIEEANAERLLKAWNNYEEMKELLKELTEELRALGGDSKTKSLILKSSKFLKTI